MGSDYFNLSSFLFGLAAGWFLLYGIETVINRCKKEKIITRNLQLIQNFGRLKVRAGDIIVIRHPRILNKKSLEHLKAFIEKSILPIKVKVLILEDGMDIGTLNKLKE